MHVFIPLLRPFVTPSLITYSNINAAVDKYSSELQLCAVALKSFVVRNTGHSFLVLVGYKKGRQVGR